MRFNYCESRSLSCLYLLLFINSFHVKVKSQTCTTFKNAVIQFRNVNGGFFNKTIDGCIERIKFDKGEAVTEALIRKENDLVRLGRDTVRNMAQLSRLTFVGCNYLEILEVGCFRNVPTLKKIQITFCKIRHIPKGVFNALVQVEIIKLNNNIMETIEDEAFGHLPSLKRIYGGHNNLKSWSQIWFSDSKALEIIDFENNKIQAIPPKAFSSFTKLKEIHFENNLIESVGREAFYELANLEYVDLSYNRIKEIKGDIFPLGFVIGSLKLHENLLNFIPDGVLNTLKVKNVNLHYNPWNCQCLEKIYQWIRATNGTLWKLQNCFDETIPECAVPETNFEHCEQHIDMEITQKYNEHLETLPKYVARCKAQT